MTTEDTREFLMRKVFLALLAILAFATTASAQTFPSRPITIIVPFSAGGPSDVMARILAERMKVALGEAVLIENVTGAGGSIGVGRAVRSPPDGYTVSFGHLGTHVANGAIYKLGYDLVADLEPVVLLPSNPMIVVSKNAVPAKSLGELLAWLKARPQPAAAGTAGAGSGSHIAGLYFENITGIRLQYVPYRGTGPAMNDLVAGQIDLIVDQLSNSINQVRAGTIRGYAVTDAKRAESATDIPTADEAGLPGFHMTLWSGMWVPKGTPKEIIARLNATMTQVLADSKVKQRFEELGIQITPLPQQSQEALRAFQQQEADRWWPIIKASGIKAE
jgi:tripartite-type tricarboxylate transporter receptor subunit TctC